MLVPWRYENSETEECACIAILLEKGVYGGFFECLAERDRERDLLHINSFVTGTFILSTSIDLSAVIPYKLLKYFNVLTVGKSLTAMCST